eukprot:snap_masked-scaffold_9-processed-gene-4.35-mRNA-1 protein AED:0.73 eAED:1.00 QI:0/-1/0/1/-1/1/1/0/261
MHQWIVFRILIYLFFIESRVYAALKAMFIDEDGNKTVTGPYISTRFSQYIGGFDSECYLTGYATVFTGNENPCRIDTVEQDLKGKFVLVNKLQLFNCFEESTYSNVEFLGAQGLLNSDPQPPGWQINRANIGKDPEAGKIPFLDLGMDFFLEIYVPLVTGQESRDVFINLTGCDDHNPFRRCKRVEANHVTLIGFISLFAAFLAYDALGSIKKTKSSLPRIFIIKFLAIYCLMRGIWDVFCIASGDTTVWFGNGYFPTEFQ